jgi:UDP-glucose 4-epimerase
MHPEYRPDTRLVGSAGATHLGFSRKGAEAEIGWVPRVALDEGIRRYTRWLEQQRQD